MSRADIACLPLPAPAAIQHSAQLLTLIRSEIEANGGRLPFTQFMALALTAPGLGYYSAGAQTFGTDGDFVTAPEVSALFSRCLAHQCAEILTQSGRESSLLELGAGSGVLAADILTELAALDCLPQRYFILEVSATLRARQAIILRQRIPALYDRIEWLEQLPASGFRGVMLANEVLDALPVQRFQCRLSNADTIKELAVAWDQTQNQLTWTTLTADQSLLNFITELRHAGITLPAGYISEWCPSLRPWLTSLGARLDQGALLLIDYGYSQRDYYASARRQGTLICHYRHRAHTDPLLYPGLQDISASVDFSAVAQAGIAAGLELAGYTQQNYFLFGCGLEALLAEVDPADQRRFFALTRAIKTLTLPSEMGERFKVIALTRGLPLTLRGFSFTDLRGRL